MNDGKSKGGIARAEAISPNKRSEIARKAAESRWANADPVADFEGVFYIGDKAINAAVLPDGTRIITQAALLTSIGRSRSPKAGKGILSENEYPFFLESQKVRPFVDEETLEYCTPIPYQTKTGKKGIGYRAELLPKVAEVYLKARDGILMLGGKIPANMLKTVVASDLLMRGLAQVGIVALVDEATGYQSAREKDALQKILDKFLTEKNREWAKTFPDEFWSKLLTVKGYESYIGLKTPSFVGHWVNDIIYSRLAPGVKNKLTELNPRSDKGHRKHKHHQFLTFDHGLPELKEHIIRVMAFMDISIATGQDFDVLLNKVSPKYGDTMPLDV